MRKDMVKIVLEGRGRKSGYDRKFWSRARVNRTDAENLPGRIKTRGLYGKGYWGRSEPLEKFLESRVGYLWDETFSMICEQADARSFGGYRIREMLQHLVYFESDAGKYWYTRYFEVGLDGILRQKKREYPKPTVKPITIVPTDDPNVWYEFRVRYNYMGNPVCTSPNSGMASDLEPYKGDTGQWYEATFVRESEPNVVYTNEIVGVDKRGYVIRERKRHESRREIDSIKYRQVNKATVAKIKKIIEVGDPYLLSHSHPSNSKLYYELYHRRHPFVYAVKLQN